MFSNLSIVLKDLKKWFMLSFIDTEWKKDFRDDVVDIAKRRGLLDESFRHEDMKVVRKPVFRSASYMFSDKPAIAFLRSTSRLRGSRVEQVYGVGAHPRLLDVSEQLQLYARYHEAAHIEERGHGNEFFLKVLEMLEQDYYEGHLTDEEFEDCLDQLMYDWDCRDEEGNVI